MDSSQSKIKALIQQALKEDIGTGDITTLSTVDPSVCLKGKLVAKAPGIIAGLFVFEQTLRILDPNILFRPLVEEGQKVDSGTDIARVSGKGQALLSAERVALNFLQRMSGIASMTRQFVEAVEGTKAVILDTRKTVPGLRILDKTAVRLGGGQNHRFGLFDMVLIKENHIMAAGGMDSALRRVRQKDRKQHAIEVEVKNVRELKQALNLQVDRIMLDNMNLTEMREAVEIVNGRIPLEASGNVSLQNVYDIARTGVDYISVGALTHSVRALDISFLIE